MDAVTVREALAAFYKTYRLPDDGAVNEPSVRVELIKGFSIYIPNFESRKKAVVRHDIHHVLTGYSAVMKGETEISAWELSTGCFSNWAVFTINTYGMMMGVPVNLPGIWRAWRRGQTTRNLYTEKSTVEQLMNSPVDELRSRLGLNTPEHSSRLTAVLSFAGFILFGTLFSVLSVVLLPFAIAYTLVVFAKKWK